MSTTLGEQSKDGSNTGLIKRSVSFVVFDRDTTVADFI